MNTKVVKMFVLVLVVAWLPVGVFAQTAPAGNTNAPKNIFNAFQRSKDDKDAYIVNRNNVGGPASEAEVDDLPQPFVVPTFKDGQGNDVEKAEFVPGRRDSPINMYGSENGLTETMQGSFSNSMLGNLKSPLSVINVTWGLTEPGVASGMQQATLQAMLLAQNRMLAEQSFLNQLNFHPEIRDPVALAYFSCVAKKSGTGSTGGGWTQGIAECMKDRGFDKGFDFSDDTSWITLDHKDAGEENHIFLSEYLFTQEGVNSGAGAGAGNIKVLAELQTSFRDYIGDIEFSISASKGTNSGVGSGGEFAATPSAKDAFVAKIKPRVKTASKFLKEDMIPTTYNKLLAVLKGYCDFKSTNPDSTVPGIDLATAKPQDQQGIIDDFEKRNYWLNKDKLKDDDLKDLSMDGFTFSQGFGQTLYNTLRIKDCKDLEPGSKEFGLDNIKDPTKRNGSNRSQQYIYVTAFRISRGQLIDNLISLEQFINGLTIGSFNDSFVKPRALQLLSEAVGTSNLEALYMDNMDKFKSFYQQVASSPEITDRNGGAQLQSGAKKEESSANVQTVPVGM